MRFARPKTWGTYGCFLSSLKLREFRGIFRVRKLKLVSQKLYGEEEKCTQGFGGET